LGQQPELAGQRGVPGLRGDRRLAAVPRLATRGPGWARDDIDFGSDLGVRWRADPERRVTSAAMSAFTLSTAELRARSGRKWHDYPDDVLPAWVAEMDFEVPEPIRAVLRGLTDEASYGYEPATLYPDLAQSFDGYMQRRFGWQPGTDQVL